MITVDFSKKGKAGLCDCLCDSLRLQIAEGQLKADEKLPSKRSLASHLGVSVITVQNAYERLIDEGYIYSQEKRGFFVTDISIEGRSSLSSAPQKSLQNPVTASSAASSSQKKYFFDFRNNATNVERFPFSIWAHAMRQVLSSGDEKLLQRQSVKGVYELRLALARHLASFRNMKVLPQQIIIGAGTESLYSMLVQFFGSNKKFAVENPGYHKIAKIFEVNGAVTVPVKIDESGIPVELLKENQIDIVHISPSHHFPTGLVMPIRRRLELLQWAEEKSGRYIIEDDYDSEFRFAGKPLPTLQSTSNRESVIYVNSFSKTIAPSFRISYMILPYSLAEDFEKKLGFYSCPVSAFEQFTLAKFIEAGLYERHLIRMKNYYRNIRNALIRCLEASKISSLISIREEEAGLHFLISFLTKAGGKELKKAFAEQGLNLPLLSEFYYGDNHDSSDAVFVINYSALEKEKIPQVVRRMESAIQCLL